LQFIVDFISLDKATFVGFITAGFPTRSATVDLMLHMEQGGVDVLELGNYTMYK
jgi:tryptophan synthase